MMKHRKTKPLTLGLLAIGLFMASATLGCRSAAPNHEHETAIFTNPVNAPNYTERFAAAQDSAEKLSVARAAAKDEGILPRSRASWLKIWRDLVFNECAVSLELLQFMAAAPFASDVDANMLRAFGELAPETHSKQ